MADVATIKGQIDLLAYARIEKAKWAEVEKTAKAAIEERLGTDDEGTVNGQLVIKRTRTPVTRLNGRKVEQLDPDLYAECLSTTSQVKVTVIDPTKG